MTSGSWSDELFHVDPGAGAPVFVGVQHMDEDGIYYSVSPTSPDAATSARLVADFIESVSLFGAQRHLVPLIAHGFPADGSASEFAIDLLPDADNPRYEIGTFIVAPPEDVKAALHELGTLDAAGALRLRDAIQVGVRQVHGLDASIDELGDEWHRLLARLEEVER
jgi:hypothetical protein